MKNPPIKKEADTIHTYEEQQISKQLLAPVEVWGNFGA